MEKFCDCCGSLINAAEQTCPFCGAQQEVPASAARAGGSSAPFGAHDFSGIGAAGSSATIGAALTGGVSTGGASTGANLPASAMGAEKRGEGTSVKGLTTGEWVATILLSGFLGVISVCLLIYWGWGRNAAEPRKSYARAALILAPLTGTLLAIGLFFGVFIVAELFMF